MEKLDGQTQTADVHAFVDAHHVTGGPRWPKMKNPGLSTAVAASAWPISWQKSLRPFFFFATGLANTPYLKP